jgi:ribonuclease D
LAPVQLVETDDQLGVLVEELLHEPAIALDTESNSLYAYREQICLIQLSTRQQDYLIDPLNIDDMRPLGKVVAQPSSEVVFHAAEYDIMCLKRDFGFRFATIFDTMFAARILGLEQVGLSNLLEAYFGVRLDKRFQRANWGLRPLTAQQKNYARMDTHFLLPLRDLLYQQLVEHDALVEAQEIFADLLRAEPQHHEFDEDGYWNLGAAKHFTPRQMACLRELYIWREATASHEDVPPFKIMSNEILLRLVKRNPQNINALQQTRLLKKGFIRQYGQEILTALEQGRKAKPPARPPRQRVDMQAVARHEHLKQWRKERAQQRGVESDIIIPRDTLWEIAKAAPRTLEDLSHISHLGPWRLAAYGQEILQVLASNGDGHL